MKKLALSLAVLFAVGMVSCGGNKEKENAADTTPAMEEVAVEEVTVDTAVQTPEATPEAAPAAETKADDKAAPADKAAEAPADSTKNK